MTAAQPQENAQDAGFTLIELLATLAIFSLISLVLLRSLDFGFLAWTRAKAQAANIDQVYIAQDVLRRLIEDAYPHVIGADPSRRTIDFEGTAEQLSILAPAPRALEIAGRARIVLSVMTRNGLQDLQLTFNEELAHIAPGQSPKTLIAGAAVIEFSYLGQGGAGRSAEWRTQWANEVSSPKLVRIAVAFPAGDARTWPDLLVAPRIAVDVGCTYDALTKRCRGR